MVHRLQRRSDGAADARDGLTVVFYDGGWGGYILKADKDTDLYVRWSGVCNGTDPEFIGTRDAFSEAGYAVERLNLADEYGTSDNHDVEFGRFGEWSDSGLLLNHRVPVTAPDEDVFFWLPREKLLEYAQKLRAEDFTGAMALLEKRRAETEEVVR